MKTCKTCGRDFEESFSFCPLDATALGPVSTSYSELKLLLLEPKSLHSRLLSELKFCYRRTQTALVLVRRDPFGAGKHFFNLGVQNVKRFFHNRNAVAGLTTSILLVAAISLWVLLTEQRLAQQPLVVSDTLEEFSLITNLSVDDVDGTGIGAGSMVRVGGRVGFKTGAGEGSKLKKESSQGGGGGGDGKPMPVQSGELPLPSTIPAPIPALPINRNPSLALAGIELDPALWAAVAARTFGDPTSTSAITSNGSGSLGGMGDGIGLGVGPGSGSGVGPGTNGNMGGGSKKPGGGSDGGSSGNNPEDPDKVYSTTQVHQRPRLLEKPEPQYSEEARRNQIVGTVVLRVVFSSTGEVTNIRTLHRLPFGLTEKAIAAARNIRFIPAMRDGRPVSVHMQLEYNFNLY